MDRKLTELQVEAAGLNTVAVSSSPHRCANNLKGVLVWTDVRRASDMRKRSLQSFLRILSAVQHRFWTIVKAVATCFACLLWKNKSVARSSNVDIT
eukprot:758721-Hanusia_phi.AAC.4